MIMYTLTRFRTAWICALTLAQGALLAQDVQSNHATAKLVKEQTQAEPGKTMWIGVHFKMDEEWHLYWPGRNDTGFAPEFKVTLPEGWTLGKARWQSPNRHVSAGDIIDYTYEDEMMVIFPLDVPTNVAVGEVAEVSMDVSWLICSDMCIPEKQSIKTQIRVGVAGGSKPVATQVDNFSKARAAQPRPISESLGTVNASIKDGALLVSAPGASRIEFMPAIEGIPLANAALEGAIDGASLSATLGDPDASSHGVSGIVAVFRGEKRETYWLELSAPENPNHEGAPDSMPSERGTK